MIVLDTSVLSALMSPAPDPAVIAWLDAQPAESVWTTAVTIFEVEMGLELLPRGRRRSALESAFRALVEDDLDSRILAFDRDAARQAGALAARAQRAGKSTVIRDAQIAGIVAVRRAQLATRNTKHFASLGVKLVDPWAS